MSSAARRQAATRLQTMAAQITAQAEARLAAIAAPPDGSRRTRAQRAAERAARKEIWAWRAAEIARATALIRAEVRAAGAAQSRRRSQDYRAQTRARVTQARADRQTRRSEDVGQAEAAMYEEQEQS